LPLSLERAAVRDLGFAIVGARPLAHAVAPTIVLELAISGGPVASVMLACQIAIEPAARTYDDVERFRLAELFHAGQPPRALVWMHASVVVPAFASATCVELVVPCPLDYAHSVAKYGGGVVDGVLPVVVQMSGSVFYADDCGRLQVAPIARDREARVAMPIAVWRAAVDQHYPTHTPIAIERAVVERLHVYRRERGLATIEQALEQLLDTGRPV
jgi:hypothetical protein